MRRDYYDPSPTLLLAEPVAIVGHPGAGTAAVARWLSGLTGLPQNDIERASEAAAGRSRARILMEDGASALRSFDRLALERALRRRPAGFLSLGTGCLEGPDDWAWLRGSSCLVLVERPTSVLHRRISEQLEGAPGSVVEFLAGFPATPQQLDEFLAARAVAPGLAHVHVEGGDRAASRIADDILAALDRLTDVDRNP